MSIVPTEVDPGDPGSAENPMPPPSLGWTAGLVTDPFDTSRDHEVTPPPADS